MRSDRFKGFENPYAHAILSKVYNRFRLVLLCGVLAPISVVFGTVDLLSGQVGPMPLMALLMGLAGTGVAIYTLRCDVATIRERRAREAEERSGPS